MAAALLYIVRAGATDVCDFKDDLKKFSEVSGISESGRAEDIKNELDFRKSYLYKVMDCASNEASKFQSKVKSIKTDDGEIKTTRDRIASRFGEIIAYYQIQKNLIGDLGIGGSKIFSANLKSWRNSNYDPIVDLSNNFAIFVKNQDIIQTTENRFNQINLSLKVLELSENQRVRELLQEADKNLKLAKEKNNQAGEIFKNLIWPNNAYDLMISSLEYLKNAYGNFFSIGEETGKIMSASK